MKVELPVHNGLGEQTGTITVADEVFGIEPNHAVMQQVYLTILANRRVGTHNTKTRSEVAGSTAKIRRQKGLGRSRQGSIRAPHHRHGGITFGPKPRSYRQSAPKMLRRLATRSVLSAKAASGAIRVIDAYPDGPPSTATLRDLLAALQVDRSVIVATGEANSGAYLSARNLPNTMALPARLLNVADLLNRQYLVVTVDAVRRIEALWGGERATTRRASVEAG